MKLSTRYAKAIYEYALYKGQEDVLNKEFQRLAANFTAIPQMKDLLDNPTIEKSQKLKILKTAAGGNISDICIKVLNLIVENNRVDYVQSIALMYEKLYKKDKNIISVNLQSVKPIDEITRQKLVKLITKNNEHIEFINKINDSIIGGFILEIEDYRLDASVSNQLNEIKLELHK